MRSKDGLVVLLLTATLVGCASRPALPPTPLFAGLKGGEWEDEDATRLIRQRIGDRFPVGAPEAGLADYLASQGMKPSESRVYIAGLVGLCRTPVMVRWRADEAGRIAELSIFYADTSCL